MATRSKPFRRLALAAFLAIGAGVIWGIASGFCLSVIDSIIFCQNINESLRYTVNDGTPIIQSDETHNYELRTYRDLDGEPVEKPRLGSRGNWAYLAKPTTPQTPFSRPPWSERTTQMIGDILERWYFVYDGKRDGHGYVVGYDYESKEKIGYLDRNGFRTGKPPLDEQFPIDGRNQNSDSLTFRCSQYSALQPSTTYLLTKDGLVWINPQRRTVKLIWKATDLISGTIADDLQADPLSVSNKEADSQSVQIRTPDRVMVFDARGQKTQTYLLPEELRKKTFALIPLPDGKALVRNSRRGPDELLWIDTEGKIAKRKDVHLHQRRRMSGNMETLGISFIIPSAELFGGALFCCPWEMARMDSWSPSYWNALRAGFQLWWPALLLSSLVGIVLAILCYRRHRKYGLEWTWVWIVFVLLFGLPGYFGYLVHRRWPARLECPRCGELAPRDREACFSCHQNFPEPELKGTEVFA